MGSTIGSFGVKKPFLCNGANLCYSKDIFKKLQGFDKNSEIASGDDIFLLEKMVKNYPNKTLFLKNNDVVIETNAENSLKLFFNQQIRWASKSTAYKNSFSKFIGGTVFLMNLSLLILLFSTFISPIYLKWFSLFFISKTIVDFILINKTATFLKTNKPFKYFLLISFIYPFFIVIIASFSLFKNYTWKGRTFKK
jgi:hypothetical protein